MFWSKGAEKEAKERGFDSVADMLKFDLTGERLEFLSDADLYKSFDARVWANEFVKHCLSNPLIASDRECMTTWFANALMRGYDQKTWETKEYKRMVRRAVVPWWKRWLTPLDSFGK
jgi:hypothetical protein